jgi:hypothetical protein
MDSHHTKMKLLLRCRNFLASIRCVTLNTLPVGFVLISLNALSGCWGPDDGLTRLERIKNTKGHIIEEQSVDVGKVTTREGEYVLIEYCHFTDTASKQTALGVRATVSNGKTTQTAYIAKSEIPNVIRASTQLTSLQKFVTRTGFNISRNDTNQILVSIGSVSVRLGGYEATPKDLEHLFEMTLKLCDSSQDEVAKFSTARKEKEECAQNLSTSTFAMLVYAAGHDDNFSFDTPQSKGGTKDATRENFESSTVSTAGDLKIMLPATLFPTAETCPSSQKSYRLWAFGRERRTGRSTFLRCPYHHQFTTYGGNVIEEY